MKILHLKITVITVLIYLFTCNYGYSQEGSLTINQDKAIPVLLNAKKDLNKDSNDLYKIQIYSGNRNSAEASKNNFSLKFDNWPSKMVYETPNFKIWAGNFRTRLEADRALKKIKKEFPGAFIFKPKKS